jgi:UDP-N-acetylglucosamine 2-epimerase (non-hydrolysing)
MKIVSIAGARPNFVKVAPLVKEIGRHRDLTSVLVHTGQHYDHTMSQTFFDDLEIPAPDFNLGVGSGSHAAQTADVMRRVEPVLESVRPDVVLVVGDVNSTIAAALTAVKLGITVAHVEAGLRSFDRAMPEEINRVLTDAISHLLFVTEASAVDNLRREGVAAARVHLVGNVMIDALEQTRSRWERSPVFAHLGIEPPRPYAVLTLHRPSNVDDARTLSGLLQALADVARALPIVFPVHPRVRTSLRECEGLYWAADHGGEALPEKGIVCLEPLGYLDFVALVSRARLVLTDSGGIQEETTILGVPCLTLRENTERPVTVSHGTNRIVGTDPARIVAESLLALEQPPAPRERPPLWDGRAAERIVRVLRAEGRGR